MMLLQALYAIKVQSRRKHWLKEHRRGGRAITAEASTLRVYSARRQRHLTTVLEAARPAAGSVLRLN